jgi:hypothetical protein
MELEKIKNAYNREIKKFLNRVELNHILCVAPRHENGKSWTEKECNNWIKNDRFHKISIRNIFLLNDHTNATIKDQQDEYDALNEALSKCTEFIYDKIDKCCQSGENLYELNELLRNTLILLDAKIGAMNYDTWKQESYNDEVDDIYYLIIKSKKVPISKDEIDIQTFCMPFLYNEFNFRRLMLYRLKNCLVDIYSTYLLLPSIGANPKIKFDCSPTDICELLLAISNAGVITDSEKLKAIFMDVFGISREFYNNTLHAIRNRKKDKSVFVKELSDKLNDLPSPKTKSFKKRTANTG